ncbi:hypothetical protein BGZ68_008870 [Mortierella alpina]|nr:hypothetical protein BGZ68_008870 [Mortierella alpina]
MNTPSLPSECFQLIIEHLTLDGDVATLSTLLRVNKHVCGATLPFLYNNPFQPKFHQLEGYFPECALTSLKLAKTLLMTLPRGSHTDLLTAAYQLPLDDEPRPCPIDYLSFVRHLNFDHCVFDYHRAPLDLSYNLGLEEFLKRRQKLTKGCARDRDGRYINGIPRLTILARRQLTSALCMPVLEQLQTMAIPLSEVHRYSGLVPRFRRLKNIVFKVENDRYLDQQVESIVKFVQRHTRLFEYQLQTATSPDDPAWPAIVLSKHPRYIYLRMLQLLPTMRNPTTIDETNWMPFMAKIDLISLEQVESIDAPVDASDWDHDQVLVPLRSVIINNQMQPFQGELDDIAIGFGGTLTVFKVNGCRGAQEVGPLPPLKIGPCDPTTSLDLGLGTSTVDNLDPQE